MQHELDNEEDVDPEDMADDLPRSFPFHVWGIGVLIPIAVAFYGWHCLATHSAWFLTAGRTGQLYYLGYRAWLCFIEYRGPSAIGLGYFFICSAIFAHLYVFWSWRRGLQLYVLIAEFAAAFGAACGIVFFGPHTVLTSASRARWKR